MQPAGSFQLSASLLRQSVKNPWRGVQPRGERRPDHRPPPRQVIVRDTAGQFEKVPVHEGGIIQKAEERAHRDHLGMLGQFDHHARGLAVPDGDDDPHSRFHEADQRIRNRIVQRLVYLFE